MMTTLTMVVMKIVNAQHSIYVLFERTNKGEKRKYAALKKSGLRRKEKTHASTNFVRIQ